MSLSLSFARRARNLLPLPAAPGGEEEGEVFRDEVDWREVRARLVAQEQGKEVHIPSQICVFYRHFVSMNTHFRVVSCLQRV